MTFSASSLTSTAPSPAGTALPAVGGPLAVTPPITVSRPISPVFRPVPPTVPRVDSYDELIHTCQAGDTYPSISQRYYHTPAYATALRVYNKTHWNASPRMASDGEILPGESLFIPNASKLTNRHGNLVQQDGAGNSGAVRAP